MSAQERVFVLGFQFGPQLIVLGGDCADALGEFDEHFGERIDIQADAKTLADYDGATPEEQLESAMNCGEARMNDCGTLVWVDPYEWCNEYRSLEAAKAALSDWDLSKCKVVEL